MKTLMELDVGDKVIIDGGGWAAKAFISTVEKATPARITAGGTVFSRSTGLGPSIGSGRDTWATTRLSVRPASDDDVARARARAERAKKLSAIKAFDMSSLDDVQLDLVILALRKVDAP